MKPVSREDIFLAKADRRKRLRALPLEEKVRMMEALQKMGRTLMAARKQLVKGKRDEWRVTRLRASGRQVTSPEARPSGF